VMPVMQRDAAFAGPVIAPAQTGKTQDNVFAPA
jgi:hypothetical protein